MKLKSSIVAIIALSGMSFAGGMIMEPAYENEVVDIPVEPVVEEYVAPPAPTPTPTVEIKKEPIKVEVKKEVIKDEPKVEKTSGGLYIAGGLAIAAASKAHEDISNILTDEVNQDRQIGFTVRLGYDFMNYLGAELRSTYGFAKAGNKYSKYNQVGAYLKPNYDITNALNVYGLIGASKSNGAGISASETGLSYGLGIDYSLSDKLSVFTDYLNLMDKKNAPESSALTVGAAYKF